VHRNPCRRPEPSPPRRGPRSIQAAHPPSPHTCVAGAGAGELGASVTAGGDAGVAGEGAGAGTGLGAGLMTASTGSAGRGAWCRCARGWRPPRGPVARHAEVSHAVWCGGKTGRAPGPHLAVPPSPPPVASPPSSPGPAPGRTLASSMVRARGGTPPRPCPQPWDCPSSTPEPEPHCSHCTHNTERGQDQASYPLVLDGTTTYPMGGGGCACTGCPGC
jgi:hypothetical protein